MHILIDERESQLFDACKLLIPENTVSLEKRVLHLGDAVIQDDESKEILLFERKSIRDLLASIKDGRYEEQSHRLIHSSQIHSHNILYIVEGMYSQTRDSKEKQTVLSAISSLLLFKGFSVLRTCSLNETAETIVSIALKLERDFKKGKMLAFSNTIGHENVAVSVEEPVKKYCEVVKKVKKDNITPQNVGEIILSQIPGISSTTAMTIMGHFTSFSDFMEQIRNQPDALKDMQYTDSSGKMRKISSSVLKNIRIYLLGENL
jgi:ERCC4-type nuclease